MNVDFPIEKVGHNHVRQPVTRPATCENPEYYVDLCMNEENGLVPEGSCKEPEKLTPVDLEEKGALGHKYQQSGIENPKINGTNTAPTKITYTYGESFDPDGMEVTATYASGETKDVT